MRFKFVGLLIVCLWVCSYGSLRSSDTVSYRKFDQAKIEKLKSDPDFAYVDQSKVKHWWTSLYEWIAKTLSNLFKDKTAEEIGALISILFRILIWGLVLFAVAMVVYSLYKMGAFGVLERKKQTIEFSISDLESRVLETNWNQLISEAIANRQYNVAIRLLFLQLLQSLNNGNKIQWAKSKSIREYQNELTQDYRKGFSLLARYYQYSWFGDVEIDESHFNEIQNEFKVFESNVGKV